MNVELGNVIIFVKIINKNNRNIYFRFDDNLDLIVTCPKRTRDDEIYDLIKQNEESLLKMYDKAKMKKDYDEEFWLFGKKYNIIYDENLIEVKIDEDIIHVKDDDMLEKYVHEKMIDVFSKEVDLCKKCFNNLPEFTLKYCKMKTRWGVCNRKDNIVTLNTELVKKDVRLLDYVIIHELAHFYEGNHSKNFWNIVSQACPDYKKRRGELRK